MHDLCRVVRFATKYLENWPCVLQDCEQELQGKNLGSKLVGLGICRGDLVQGFHRQFTQGPGRKRDKRGEGEKKLGREKIREREN